MVFVALCFKLLHIHDNMRVGTFLYTLNSFPFLRIIAAFHYCSFKFYLTIERSFIIVLNKYNLYTFSY